MMTGRPSSSMSESKNTSTPNQSTLHRRSSSSARPPNPRESDRIRPTVDTGLQIPILNQWGPDGVTRNKRFLHRLCFMVYLYSVLALLAAARRRSCRVVGQAYTTSVTGSHRHRRVSCGLRLIGLVAQGSISWACAGMVALLLMCLLKAGGLKLSAAAITNTREVAMKTKTNPFQLFCASVVETVWAIITSSAAGALPA